MAHKRPADRVTPVPCPPPLGLTYQWCRSELRRRVLSDTLRPAPRTAEGDR